MTKYIIEIFSMKSDLRNEFLEEITIEAEDKNSAIDKAHDYAFNAYGDVRHFLEIKPQGVWR